MENKTNKKTLGYRLGEITAAVVAGCALSLLIAFTIKLICMMF